MHLCAHHCQCDAMCLTALWIHATPLAIESVALAGRTPIGIVVCCTIHGGNSYAYKPCKVTGYVQSQSTFPAVASLSTSRHDGGVVVLVGVGVSACWCCEVAHTFSWQHDCCIQQVSVVIHSSWSNPYTLALHLHCAPYQQYD